jgi:hypothetical protein
MAILSYNNYNNQKSGWSRVAVLFTSQSTAHQFMYLDVFFISSTGWWKRDWKD